MAYKSDQQTSRNNFQVVSGQIEQKLNCKIIYDLEAHDTSLCTIIDRECASDYLIKTADGVSGLAWRAQTSGKNWRTFTVRAERESGRKTELEKLKSAQRAGCICPAYTVQVYYTAAGQLIGGAIVRTKDLVQLIEAGESFQRETKAGGAAVFECVEFAIFEKNGLFIQYLEAAK